MLESEVRAPKYESSYHTDTTTTTTTNNNNNNNDNDNNDNTDNDNDNNNNNSNNQHYTTINYDTTYMMLIFITYNYVPIANTTTIMILFTTMLTIL